MGIVFEVVSMEEDTLEWAVPVVNDYSGRLRKRFPGIKLALVTHRMEQFALTRIHADCATFRFK